MRMTMAMKCTKKGFRELCTGCLREHAPSYVGAGGVAWAWSRNYQIGGADI